MKTSKNNGHMSDLTAKLTECDPEVQHYVAALKAQRVRLLKQIAELQAENELLEDRIKILKGKGGEIKFALPSVRKKYQ